MSKLFRRFLGLVVPFGPSLFRKSSVSLNKKFGFFGPLVCPSICLLASFSFSACKTAPEFSQTTSSDERPDISEDRSQVKFTSGTNDFSILKASDLKISIHFEDKKGVEQIKEMTGRMIRYVYQHPVDHRFAVAVEFSEGDAKTISMVFVGQPSSLDKVSPVGYYLKQEKNQLASKKMRAMHEIMNLFFDAKNHLHVIESDELGNSAELIFTPENEFHSCESLKSQTEGVSLCDVSPMG